MDVYGEIYLSKNMFTNGLIIGLLLRYWAEKCVNKR